MVVRRMALLLTQEQIPLLPTVLQSLIAVWCALCRALSTSCRLPLRPLDPSCLQWHASLLTRRRALSLPRCLRCVGVGTTVAVPGAAQGSSPLPRMLMFPGVGSPQHGAVGVGVPRHQHLLLMRTLQVLATAALSAAALMLSAAALMLCAPHAFAHCCSRAPLPALGQLLCPSVLLMPATVMLLSMGYRAPHGYGFCTCAVCAHVHVAQS